MFVFVRILGGKAHAIMSGLLLLDRLLGGGEACTNLDRPPWLDGLLDGGANARANLDGCHGSMAVGRWADR